MREPRLKKAKTTRILLVEDSPADAQKVRCVLSEARGAMEIRGGLFAVEWVGRLDAALQSLSARPFSVVLLSLQISMNDGLKALARLRAAADAPIVVLTDYDDDGLALAAIRRGAQDYVAKDRLDGRLSQGNPTHCRRSFEPGRWYCLRLRVTKERIKAWIDDEQVVDLATAGHAFSTLSVYAPVTPFGICTWETSTAVRDIKLRRVTAGAEGPVKAPKAGEWQSLFDGKTLTGWEIAEGGEFDGHGGVVVKSGSIILQTGRSKRTGITFNGSFPKEDYEVRFEAKRLAGDSEFASTVFPIGSGGAFLVVGASYGVGLHGVDGRPAWANLTTRSKRFETGRWYELGITVTKSKVQVRIDGATIIDVTRGDHRFELVESGLALKPFGFTMALSQTAIRDVRLMQLGAKGEQAVEAPKAGQ